MDTLDLIYPNHNVKVYITKSNIDKIVVDEEVIPFRWNLLREQLINPGENISSSLIDTPYKLDNLISNLSVTSVDIETNFIRGLSVILILQRLIVKEKYLRISSLPDDYTIFTRNSLKGLRVAIIIHLKAVGEDRMLKHALDFTNRWCCLFHEGDKIDKLDLMTELIVKYLTERKEIANYDSSLLTRIRRIESILGINSQSLNV